MRIIYETDYKAMSRAAANIISAQIILKPDCVLGLATGSSPVGTYAQLIEWYKKGDLDFSQCKAVNLDEYCGLSKDDKHSYAYFMRENLFNHINIDAERTFIPDGLNPDAEAECERYDHVIEQLGGIDLQLLGVGHNGHIGFNEPGHSLKSGTNCVELTERTISANTRFFEREQDVPKKAYTMGLKSIMNARRIVLVVSGESKADILYELVVGQVTTEVPASLLQLHPDTTIVADAPALSKLAVKAPELISNFQI